MNLTARVSVVALLAAGALPALAVAQQVGTVAAVNRDMTGTPPDATPRELDLGLDVVRNERVETSPVGSGQLMFLDQTTLTVSPNADIVLDEYVYDPDAGTSDLALSMTRGALRFIGGRITKTDPAQVRTPTATVGIRGGMAVLDIDGQGDTRVVHIAGEYTSVMQCGDADGDGLDDVCAPDEARSHVVLSRPNASARATRGEGVAFTGLADAGELAGIYGMLEGQGQGGLDRAPSEGAVEGGTVTVASVNSGIPGGAENRPVSTSGEQAAPGSGQAESFTEAAVIAANNDPTVGGDPGAVEPPTGTLVPEGGAAFSPTMGYQPFTSVVAGSLIGRSGEETIEVPVPDSPDALLSEHPEGAAFTPRAVSLYPNAGLFEFGPETATSSTLGPLEGEFGITGVGLADFDNEFVFVPFVAGSDLGIAMFGTPTPGQGQFFPNDPETAGAQTVDTYHNEFGLDLGRSFLFIGDGGRHPVPEQLFLVGKSGEPRFAPGLSPTIAAVENGEVDGIFGPIGRAVSGGLQIEGEGFGRSERLALFVEPLTTSDATPAEEMTISGNGFVTLNEGSTLSFGQPAYGTFEDAEGNTLFGPDANYFVLSSVHRERGGALDTTDFGTGQAFLSETAPGGVTTNESPFRASLFTRDESLSEVIDDPLPLAGQPNLTGGANSFDGGFATGFAVCSSGNCGNFEGGEVPNFTGVYPLFSASGPAGVRMTFDPNTAGMSFDFALSARSIAGEASGFRDSFVFSVGANTSFESVDQWGAYLDDRRFAAVGTGFQVIADDVQEGTVGMGSSGLVGTPDGLFPAETETRPEYLRWGFWAATYQVAEGVTEQTRTDLVPVGTFVTGNLPDPQTMPFTGTASYDGFAAGSVANLADGTTRTVGGSFGMTYDFGSQSGQVDIALRDNAISPISVGVTGQTGNIVYGGVIDSQNGGMVDAEVSGAFFAGGGNPVAATAGNFGIHDHATNSAAVGVFGGDQTGFIPGGPPDVASAQ